MSADIGVSLNSIKVTGGDLLLQDNTSVDVTLKDLNQRLKAVELQLSQLGPSITAIQTLVGHLTSNLHTRQIQVYDDKLTELRKPIPGCEITPSDVSFGYFEIAPNGPPIITGFSPKLPIEGQIKGLQDSVTQIKKKLNL